MYQNLHNPQDQCVSSETKSYSFINYLMLCPIPSHIVRVGVNCNMEEH